MCVCVDRKASDRNEYVIEWKKSVLIVETIDRIEKKTNSEQKVVFDHIHHTVQRATSTHVNVIGLCVWGFSLFWPSKQQKNLVYEKRKLTNQRGFSMVSFIYQYRPNSQEKDEKNSNQNSDIEKEFFSKDKTRTRKKTKNQR